MPHWTERIYTCKNCKKSVTITPKDEYICSECNTPIFGTGKISEYYLGFNPMAMQTKMEFSDSNFDDTVQRFRNVKHGNV